jgi:2,4-dienoyl-CoA reductase-like NADH-dependent reductase (Old Yellow Enzyme family)
VLEAVQSEWPIELPLFVRTQTGQMEAEESVQLLYLKRKGVDLIDVSSGALVPYQKIPSSQLPSAIC